MDHPNSILTTTNILMPAFYANYECCILHNGHQSDWFLVTSEVRQRCIISPLLFIIAVDWCMRTTFGNKNTGIRWTMNSFLEDLAFADDICLFSCNINNMQSKTNNLNEVALGIGLKINENKTEVMTMNNYATQPQSPQDIISEEQKRWRISNILAVF